MRKLGIVTILVLASACQHYAPAPLAHAIPLRPAAAVLAETPAGALTVGEVVRLALADDPDLVAARAKRGVAQGQWLQSGLLPNPSLSGAFLPLLSGVGTVPAWTAGLSQDVKALITYRSRRRAGRDAAAQVYADLLWQEWQVAGQARQLALDLIETQHMRPVAAEAYTILRDRNAAVDAALAAGNTTLVVAAPSRLAFQTARANLNGVDQRILTLRHQLNALLGLVPDAALTLVPTVDMPPLDIAAARASIATLPDRRPDLLALRLGYAAQEEVVRQAILSQFPDLVLGGAASSDNSRVINAGPNVSIGLPIFDRNQGNIAIAQATREQLRGEYAARLASTAGEVGAALTEIEQFAGQLAVARRDLPAARLAAARAAAARGASAIDEAAFVDLITTRFSKEQDVMALELALQDRQVAVETLLGLGLPSVDTLPDVADRGARR